MLEKESSQVKMTSIRVKKQFFGVRIDLIFMITSVSYGDGRLVMLQNCNLKVTYYKAADKMLKEFSVDPFFNPYKPSIPFVGHRQTVQTQIRRCRTWRLIRVFTVC